MSGVITAAWLDVRSAPMRTLAAIGGLIAAIIAVIMVNAASELSEQANEQYIAQRWGKVATFSIATYGLADPMRNDPQAPTSMQSHLANSGVSAVSTNLSISGSIVVGDRDFPVSGYWVSESYPDVVLMDTSGFEWPTETRDLLAPRIVISDDMARELGMNDQNAIGQIVYYAPAGVGPGVSRQSASLQPVVIAGVSDDFGVGAAESDFLLVSDAYLSYLILEMSPPLLVHVHPADARNLAEIVSAYPYDEQARAIRMDQAEDLAPVLNQQRTTARVVTLIALAIGGLGILGVGLAGVRERSRDFGLRRAIGANKRMIFAGVIAQTLIEVGIAIAIALPMAAALVHFTARSLVLSTLPMPASTTLPAQAALIGVVGALVVGLVAGMLPAYRAARTSVIEALHG